ncbi:uncharacterized protein LOC110924348 [Helianthus annuus]|uniref:uncharacterized protein LOC110924348 n=1 Tax=Helianthus annuus TaxID=4232 RepID=UPI000B901806|nr:uncharacterized protein LOC110924348 [Helianthus annuus]
MPKVTKLTIKPFKTTGVQSEKEKKTAEEPVDTAVEKEKQKKKTKERTIEKPVEADPKDTGTAAATPHHEKRKEPEVEKPTEPAPANAPVQTAQVTSTTGGSSSAPHKDKTAAAGGASSGGARGFIPRSPIGPKDTAYVVGEANTRAANHQIVREWRTMVKERADWEKYRERLVRQAKEFEKANAAFAEEKAKFETDKKSKE